MVERQHWRKPMHCAEELDNRFHIAKSTQKGAGEGLFANESLRKGDRLDIVGVVAKRECVKYADGYSFETGIGQCWVPLGFGAIVNHATNPANQNVEYTHDPQPAYCFMRDIEEGEELLTSYGAGFANTLAVYSIVEGKENLIEWEQDCVEIADSKEGKEFYASIFGTP